MEALYSIVIFGFYVTYVILLYQAAKARGRETKHIVRAGVLFGVIFIVFIGLAFVFWDEWNHWLMMRAICDQTWSNC